MTRYIVNRLFQAVLVFFLLSVIVFMLVRIVPEDPIYSILGADSAGFTTEQRQSLMKQYGLDRSLPMQYYNWLKGFFIGDWGKSFQTRRPVTEELSARLPYTVVLAAAAMLLSIVVGVAAGVVAALKRNSVLDILATAGAMFGVAVPDFWFALMMILLFGVTLGWLPVFGAKPIWSDPIDGLRHLVLPSVALGLAGAATLMRQTRSSMLEVMGEDYIRTARSKGLRERRVIWLHALRNSLLPVVTVIGLRIGHVFGGAVIIETMFSWPGVGRLAVTALQKADYPVVQAIIMVSSAAILIMNLLTDLTYGYLDPRIRYT